MTFYVYEDITPEDFQEHDKTNTNCCLYAKFKLRISDVPTLTQKLAVNMQKICKDQRKDFDRLQSVAQQFLSDGDKSRLNLYQMMQNADSTKIFTPIVYEITLNLTGDSQDSGFWADIGKDMYKRHQENNWQGMHEESDGNIDANHKHEFTHFVKALGKYVFKVQFRDGTAIHYKLPQRTQYSLSGSSGSLSFHHTHFTKKTQKQTYTDPHTWTLTVDEKCSKMPRFTKDNNFLTTQ